MKMAIPRHVRRTLPTLLTFGAGQVRPELIEHTLRVHLPVGINFDFNFADVDTTRMTPNLTM